MRDATGERDRRLLRTAGLSGDDDRSPPTDDELEGPATAAATPGASVLTGAVAAVQPMLVVLEDVHWAEPALLELVVGSLAAADARGPLVVLCLARDDLLRAQPDWGSGMRDETTVTLDGARQSEYSAGRSAAVGDEQRRQAVELAGGNPFFLEEMLAMTGGGRRPRCRRPCRA